MDVVRVRVFWIALIGFGLSANGRTHADSTSSALVEANRLFSAGRFVEAIPLFDQVIARHPRDLSTRNKRGICYLRNNRPVEALTDFDRIRDSTSRLPLGFGDAFPTMFGGEYATFPEASGNRGIALLMLGRNEEALDSFQTAISQWSTFLNRPHGPEAVRGRAGAYQGAARAYHQLGQEDAALEFSSKAIEIDPTDPNGYCGRADIMASRRAYDVAIADYRHAIDLDPAHSRAIAGLGFLSYDQGRDDIAIAQLDRAIALDPNFAKAYSYRGAAFARKGQNARALADYDKLLAIVPDDPGALEDRGGILVRLNRFDGAIESLNKAIRIDPKRAAAYQNRGAAYNGLGQFEKAIEDLSQAIRLAPANSGSYGNRGLAHFAIGQYDQSVVDLSEAIERDPQSAVARLNRADVFARLGLRDRAAVDLDQATKLDPHLVASYTAAHRLGGSSAGQPPERDMALRVDSKDVSSHYERANEYRERGEWSAALTEYDRVLATQPDKTDAYVARGWARLCAGAPGAAADAHAYRTRMGWNDPFVPYMAILEALGEGASNNPSSKRHSIDEALEHLAPHSWPAPVLRYLRGDLNESALLRQAFGPRQLSEAHAFLGIDRLQSGDSASAIFHLRKAVDLGKPGSIATDVARAILGRQNTLDR